MVDMPTLAEAQIKKPVVTCVTTGFFKIGGPNEDRTHDLRIANAALSQLSYRPTKPRIISIKTAGE